MSRSFSYNQNRRYLSQRINEGNASSIYDYIAYDLNVNVLTILFMCVFVCYFFVW